MNTRECLRERWIRTHPDRNSRCSIHKRKIFQFSDKKHALACESGNKMSPKNVLDWATSGDKGPRETTGGSKIVEIQGAKAGVGGHRSPYLSHAKRALYHLSYNPSSCSEASWPRYTNPLRSQRIAGTQVTRSSWHPSVGQEHRMKALRAWNGQNVGLCLLQCCANHGPRIGRSDADGWTTAHSHEVHEEAVAGRVVRPFVSTEEEDC